MKPIYIVRHIIDRDPAVKAYFKEISKFPLLTPEQEADLAQKAQQGDTKAKEQLINSNLRFVVSIATQYPKGSLELIDLISEGNIGLIRAADNFDPTRGFRFLSYAVFWIRQAIISAVNSKSRLVRIPDGKVHTMRKVYSFIAEFEQQQMRRPSLAEMEEALDLPQTVLKDIIGADAFPISITTPLNSLEPDFTLEDMLTSDTPAPDDNTDDNTIHNEFRRILAKVLTARELKVLFDFYGIGTHPHQLEDIADELGIGKERARQILDMAMRKMQHSPYTQCLQDFL